MNAFNSGTSATLDGFSAVSMDELEQIEGGGKWRDRIVGALKFVATVVVTALVQKGVGKV